MADLLKKKTTFCYCKSKPKGSFENYTPIWQMDQSYMEKNLNFIRMELTEAKINQYNIRIKWLKGQLQIQASWITNVIDVLVLRPRVHFFDDPQFPRSSLHVPHQAVPPSWLPPTSRSTEQPIPPSWLGPKSSLHTWDFNIQVNHYNLEAILRNPANYGIWATWVAHSVRRLTFGFHHGLRSCTHGSGDWALSFSPFLKNQLKKF